MAIDYCLNSLKLDTRVKPEYDAVVEMSMTLRGYEHGAVGMRKAWRKPSW